MANYNSIYTGQQIDAAIGIANSLASWTKASSKPSYNFSEITGRYHTLISWDGPSINSNISPLGAAMSLSRSACRTDFIHANAITIEASDDGGTTWVAQSASDNSKRALFTTNLGYSLPMGVNTPMTLNSRVRVTLTAQNGSDTYLYTNPRKILMDYSSPNPGKVLIEVRTGTNYLNNGSWVDKGTYNISGWSAWNDIPFVLGTLGGGTASTANYWQIRFTFSYSGIRSGYENNRKGVSNILIFGENDWTRASTAADFGPISGTGHLYSYDANANATFPKKLAAKEFIENGTAIDTIMDNKIQAAIGNAIAASY